MSVEDASATLVKSAVASFRPCASCEAVRLDQPSVVVAVVVAPAVVVAAALGPGPDKRNPSNHNLGFRVRKNYRSLGFRKRKTALQKFSPAFVA